MQHHFVVPGDLGKLEITLRAHEVKLQFVHLLPSFFVFGKDHIDKTPHDSQLGGRVFLRDNFWLKMPLTTKHIVDGEIDHGRINNPASHTAQGFDVYDIDIGSFRKATQEIGIRFDTRRMQIHFASATNHVEKLKSHGTCKALMDQLERWHPPAEDAMHFVKHGSFRLTRCLEHILTEILILRIVVLRLYCFTH